MKRIKRIINDISILLGVNPPNIKYGSFNGYFNDLIIIKKEEYHKSLFIALHELRHHYQMNYIKNNDDYISLLLRYEMDNYNNLDYKNLYMEMDAYYFSVYVFMYILKMDYKIDNVLLDMILKYISEYTFIFGGLYGRCQKNR